MQSKATVYLIPVPIAEGATDTLSPQIRNVIGTTKHFFVENLRSARRAIKLIHPAAEIDTLRFSAMDKHTGVDKNLLKDWLKSGHAIGVISESGCPGVADPGAEIVSMAQQAGAKVVALTGPNSILLALMASGLNGQSFAFVGYLPVKEPMRSQRIKSLELRSAKENQTQIFIETPYRNSLMLEDLLKNCSDQTRLCIACDITGQQEWIVTRTIKEWKNQKPVLQKQPTVFLIMAS